MSDMKTRETDADVAAFLAGVENQTRRRDARELVALIRRVTGREPKMWGPSIIGFGRYRYRYESGREGEWMRIGFSPRKANLAFYLMSKGEGYDALLPRLGKYRTGVSCLYVNKLADVDMEVLEAILASAWESAGREFGEEG